METPPVAGMDPELPAERQDGPRKTGASPKSPTRRTEERHKRATHEDGWEMKFYNLSALTTELGASESDVARVFRNEDPLEVIATSAGLRKLTILIKKYREREQANGRGLCFRGLDSDTSRFTRPLPRCRSRVRGSTCRGPSGLSPAFGLYRP